MEAWGVLVGLVGLVVFFIPSSSSSGATQVATIAQLDCSSDDSQNRIISALAVAKKNLAKGYYSKSQQEATVIENTAHACIEADQDADEYHYVHVNAAIIEAQDRMARGDAKGALILENSVTEAQDLADKSDADAQLRKMAKGLATEARYELRQVEAAQRGQLIKVPPTPNN